MNDIKVIRQEIAPGRRILVTSDIHGHLNHLKRVLNKAKFCVDDLLVIVGDVIEKGPESLKTLRYVMIPSGKRITLRLARASLIWKSICRLRMKQPRGLCWKRKRLPG